MDLFIESSTAVSNPFGIEDMPIFALGDALLSRWWRRHRVERQLMMEADWRVRHELFLPTDAYEIPSPMLVLQKSAISTHIQTTGSMDFTSRPVFLF